MKLEKSLIELSTLVDYGIKYLAEREVMKCEFHSDEWINVADVVEYVLTNYSVGELGYDDDEICQYVKDSIGIDYILDDVSLEEFMESKDISTDDVLDDMCCYDICEYLSNTHDIEHILNQLNDKDLFDYITNNYALSDWVQWKEKGSFYE